LAPFFFHFTFSSLPFTLFLFADAKTKTNNTKAKDDEKKKLELEKRLMDVTGQLGETPSISSAGPSKKGSKKGRFRMYSFFCFLSFDFPILLNPGSCLFTNTVFNILFLLFGV